MTESQRQTGHGPFRVEQLHEEDRYELSDGHPIYCAPAGRDHASRSLTGSLVLATDPVAEWSGIDAGYQSDAGTLRAPDIAVGPKPEKDGWIPGAPPLAVEYAGRGQDEAELQDRIADLLAAGTRYVWVVRLVGPRRVEVYAKDEPLRVYGADDTLQAPGILRNPVRVQALYDREIAHEAVLTNLLQRRGYDSLDAVLAEGEANGEARALLTVLEARGVAMTEAERAAILNSRDLEQLRVWLQRAVVVDTAAALFK
ncbi:MAG: Uma2 family endonuclease [Candidatus Competibacteraceae bacterium]